MDKMKKILSSPMAKKKSNGNKIFGVPLEELVRRAPEDCRVPVIVKTIVDFISQHGIGHEGIFRINGNARMVEKLKSSYDKVGSANLEDANDVMSVAGLLKLFLRELPDSVIPESETLKFIQVQEDFQQDFEQFIDQLKQLLEDLPQENYDLLKFLCRFLVTVSLLEESNKMSSMALAIIFGPNLFRCSNGFEGLREQGKTNQILNHFIQDYDALFKSDDEISPYASKLIQVQEARVSAKTPPTRPPPPKFEESPPHPIPSPRKSRHILNNDQDSWERDSTEVSSHGGHTPRSRSASLNSPRYSDDESMLDSRAYSPFVLESDGGSSVVTSPIISMVASDLVEKTISEAVSEHLFGDMFGDSRPSTPGSCQGTPVPVPRKRKEDLHQSPVLGSNNESPDEKTSVQDRIRHFQSDDSDDLASDIAKPRRQRPTSQAFKMFEEQGTIIGMGQPSMSKTFPGRGGQSISIPDDLADSVTPEDTPRSMEEEGPRPVPRPRSSRLKSDSSHVDENGHSINADDLKDTNDSSGPVLSNFKRDSGPKNRRTPSRKAMKQVLVNQNHGNTDAVDSLLYEEYARMEQEDENHNDPKHHMGFLDVHSQEDAATEDKHSPAENRKPYVPPLDLTILHEHGDGSDPILAEHGPSPAFHKAKSLKEEEEVLLSPRSSKIKKRASAHGDTDIPPSPPLEQNSFPHSGFRHDDEYSDTVKQLTKKIQSLKRKIKQFEEQFETKHGYKPSQTDKAARLEVKRHMADLQKARKELKQFKEENMATSLSGSSERLADAGFPSNRSRPTSSNRSTGRPSSGKIETSGGDPPTMKQTLDMLMKKLKDKRLEAHRNSDLNEMTREHVQDEKLAVQKALLHFESIHGRPSTKAEKELMRPLYDRYRNIKRLLAKPASPRDKHKELEPVPEDTTIEQFAPKSAPGSAKSTNREPIKIPTSEVEAEPEQEQEEEMTTQDFAVTRDFPGDNVEDNDTKSPEDFKNSRKNSEAYLHELTVPELISEQNGARNTKKELRKVLREFEDEFLRQTGRKVQKEDRAPMDAEYNEYKQIKARLKLLDALLSKHDPTATI
ncbi:unnamed protein product [Owenia fusiformis]|nr:unnamed protein product [Owenia fusiformis]